MEPYRISRREMRRALRHGWRGRLRSGGVLVPLGLGLAMLAGAALWYWQSYDFARRSIVTEAVVERADPVYRIPSEDGPSTLLFRGVVRYEAGGETVRSRLTFANCRRRPCAGEARPGDRMTVAYDPDSVRRAKRAPPGGLSATPHPGILVLGGVGSLFAVVAGFALLRAY